MSISKSVMAAEAVSWPVHFTMSRASTLQAQASRFTEMMEKGRLSFPSFPHAIAVQRKERLGAYDTVVQDVLLLAVYRARIKRIVRGGKAILREKERN